MAMPSDAVDAYTEPGSTSIIDVIDPATGLTWVNAETFDAVLLRYPTAVRVNFAEWMAAKAATQDTPIVWRRTSERRYHEMLEVLPPARWIGGAFLVGEPTDHSAATGAPRFSAYRRIGSSEDFTGYEVANRPLTVREFLTAIGRSRDDDGGN